MIDLHTHLLPRLDDGAATLAEAAEMARAVVREGVTIAAATPHVRADYPTDAETMEAGVAALRNALVAAEVPLDVRTGGELSLDFIGRLDATEIRRFGLAGNPGYLLLEFPYLGWPLQLESQVQDLRSDGIVAVLAHPERNGDVHERPERLQTIVEAGALVQMTAGSLAGALGSRAKLTAFALLNRDLVHLVATDVHSPVFRAGGFAGALRALGDEELGRWLVEGVPAAIVAGTPLPPKPLRHRQRRWFPRLR